MRIRAVYLPFKLRTMTWIKRLFSKHISLVAAAAIRIVVCDISGFLSAIENRTLLKKSPRLTDIANWVVFMASDQAQAMTGAIINLSCGAIAD